MKIKETNPEIHGYILGLKIARIKYWSASTGDCLIEVQTSTTAAKPRSSPQETQVPLLIRTLCSLCLCGENPSVTSEDSAPSHFMRLNVAWSNSRSVGFPSLFRTF